MRVITGAWKGRSLQAPAGRSFRPTMDLVKQAMFSVLEDVSDLTVLDLFCGSGALGLEALSRGAAYTDFVDDGAAAWKAVGANIEMLGCGDRCRVWRRKAAKYLQDCEKKFNLILIDPPYQQNLLAPVVELLPTVCNRLALVMLEHSPREKVIIPPGFVVLYERVFGQTALTCLQYQPTTDKEATDEDL